jgi:hypothetical protein
LKAYPIRELEFRDCKTFARLPPRAILSDDFLWGFLGSIPQTVIAMITIGFEKGDRHPLIFLLGFLLDLENRNIN